MTEEALRDEALRPPPGWKPPHAPLDSLFGGGGSVGSGAVRPVKLKRTNSTISGKCRRGPWCRSARSFAGIRGDARYKKEPCEAE
jgi:hypothetical protein